MKVFQSSLYLLFITIILNVANANAQNHQRGSATEKVKSEYNSVGFNGSTNQVRLYLGSDIKYYDTEKVSVGIDKTTGTVAVTEKTGAWQDIYIKTVNKIDFSLAVQDVADGDIQQGEISITEAKGWKESLYVKWQPYNGASSYNVYVRGGQYSDYTRIDGQLIRDYGAYVRADIVGLVAGNDYAAKIVAVDNEGNEIASTATEATGIAVVNYSREGFAHFNRTEGVGAYNNDGSLKKGAKVMYVTANTAKIISTEVKVGSSKSELFTGMQSIIDAYQKGYDTTPIVFRLIGKIDIGDLDHTSSSSEGMQIKGKNSYSPMNITIEGIGDDATVFGFGFLVRNSSSIELRNFAIMRCLDDAISIDTDNSNIWIHNMDLFYGQRGSASDQAKGDGTVDLKGDSKYITIDNNHFWDSGKASMCGMKSESGPNYITYHHNWFDHSDSRHPRIRTMSVHVYNNYFDHNDVYGIGATTGASVFADRNYFNVAYRPIMSSKQGTDAKGDGTFSGETGGIIKAYGNVMTNKTSNFSYITYADDNASFDAYEVSSPDEIIPNNITALYGGAKYDNFDTTPSLMYSYSADNTADVPNIVTGYYGAGRMNHGDIDYVIPDEAIIQNGHHQPIPELAELIDNYESALVNVFGDEVTQGGETGNGGDSEDGKETGEDSPIIIEGAVTCYFSDKVPSNPEFTVTKDGGSASYTTKSDPMTIDGITYTNALKIESKTKIEFTISADMVMTLYLGSASADNVKFDGETISGSKTTTGTIITTNIHAGNHIIGRGSGEGHLYLIELVPYN